MTSPANSMSRRLVRSGMLPSRGRSALAASGSPQWVRATRDQVGLQAYLAVWFWGLVVVGIVIAFLAVDYFGEVRQSILQYASYAMTWFPFSIMIVVASVSFTIHVANGMTRRSFARAALATSALTAVGYGLLMSSLLLLEGAVYDLLGRRHGGMGTGDEHGLVEGVWTSGFLTSWGTYSMLTLTGMVSGLLVGAGYYRFGWLRGTLVLPFGLVPVLGGQLLVDLSNPGSLGDRIGLDRGWYVLALVLAAALAAVAFAAIVRRSRIGSVVT